MQSRTGPPSVDVDAWFNRGEAYLSATATMTEARSAVQCFQRAAVQGHREAQFRLACCYGEGVGVRRNRASELRWLRKAAKGGHPFAAFNLGAIQIQGRR